MKTFILLFFPFLVFAQSSRVPDTYSNMPFSIKMGQTVWQNENKLLFIAELGNNIAIKPAPYKSWPAHGEFSSIFPVEEIDKNTWVMRFQGEYLALRLTNMNQLLSSESFSKQEALSNLDSSTSFSKKTWNLLR
ncbi:MAG: hypothetical protein ACRCY4_04835 [Brevinema sp.]